MRRTTLSILFSIVLVLMLSSDSNADYNIYRVGDLIIGRDYNKIWSQWSERKFGIWIGIDEENREYIFLHADTGIGPATVRINNEKQEKEKFIGFIMKSIK